MSDFGHKLNLSWQKRALRFFRKNLISTVLVMLLGLWMVISAVVFKLEYKAEGANITTFGKAVWWGIVTFLTVGYGDYSPITSWGRIMAGFLMVFGVLNTAIITSKISSYFLEQVLREGRGMVNSAQLKDHFVICGWKEDMHELLIHILDFNPELTAKDLVLLANIGQTVMDDLHEHDRLKGLLIIVGNYYEVNALKRAAPERARKVLILADRTPNATGAIASLTETDARTIMTAMTLSNIARGTLVAAEILDPKMDQYLKLASVSEIIYSREYSRLLLGNAAGGTGVSNIIFDLLDPKTSAFITTMPIGDHLFHLGYAEFKAAFEKLHPNADVIGVLENTGNSQRIKELALRQAQKTPDVSRLVQNLRGVKELRCNHPVFNPGTGYKVPEGSMAIVIENRAVREARNDETIASAA